jgi:hypothetical protein
VEAVYDNLKDDAETIAKVRLTSLKRSELNKGHDWSLNAKDASWEVKCDECEALLRTGITACHET